MPYPGSTLFPGASTFPGLGSNAFLTSTWATIGDIVFNVEGIDGVSWYLSDLPGWTGAPQGTITPVQKPRQAGAWAGLSYAKPRTLVLTGAMVAPTAQQAIAAMDLLNDAIDLDTQLLTVNEGGLTRTIAVRRDGDVLPVWLSGEACTFTAQLVAVDPRKLGVPLSDSTLLPATVGGLSIPYTIPYSIPATVVSGSVSLNNPGNETGPVILRIDGPCIGPVITHTSSSTSRALEFASSLALGTGEWLTVDMEKHVALANDQASRSKYITRREWSGFDRGDNTWAFAAASYAPTARLTVTATPAWK